MSKKKLILAAVAAAALAISTSYAQRPFGTVTVGASVTPPPGFTTAQRFKIEVPGTVYKPGNGRCEIAIAYPSGTPVDVIDFRSGHGGSAYWFKTGNTTLTAALLSDLLAANHIVVDVRWLDNGWFYSPSGYSYGFELLAGRVATAMKYVNDTIAVPLGIPYKMLGGSAGSAQIAYAMSSYGTDSFTTEAYLVSGPPFAELAKGCTQQGVYTYTKSETAMVDSTAGTSSLVGQCSNHDPAGTMFWNDNSVETGGTRYFYPTTRVVFITGHKDSWEIKQRAFDYRDQLIANGQPVEAYEPLNMAHTMQSSGLLPLSTLNNNYGMNLIRALLIP